jgi:hypothetical protein
MLHQVPVMTAHEMNFFYDEGLVTPHGTLGYEILTESMVPFGLEKLGISQAMKEKAVDIALDVQSRTVFYQRARGADLYIISGWRNQHTNVWVAPPHIKSLQDLKGKRVGISDFNSIRHWAIQIQLKKAGLDLERDIEWVRLGVNARFHVDAIRNGKVECAPVPPWSAEDLKKAGEAFLAENKKKEGVVSLPSGLQYRVLKAGEGQKPGEKDTVVCNYRAADMDGKEVGSSYTRGEPVTFQVSAAIPGLREGLQLMQAGSKWQLFVPSELAYAGRGALTMEVELISIKPDVGTSAHAAR